MKHVLHFTVGEDGVREFAVETDDLRDVASWSWFRDFLALRGSYPEREPVREIVREDPRIEELRDMVVRYAEENKRLERKIRQAELEAATPAPTPAPAPVQQQPNPVVSVSGLSDPFSLNPNQMTEQIWNTMTPQMQDQWMKKWGIQ